MGIDLVLLLIKAACLSEGDADMEEVPDISDPRELELELALELPPEFASEEDKPSMFEKSVFSFGEAELSFLEFNNKNGVTVPMLVLNPFAKLPVFSLILLVTADFISSKLADDFSRVRFKEVDEEVAVVREGNREEYCFLFAKP